MKLTTPATETQANSVWKLHPSYRGPAYHEQLAKNEFVSVEQLQKQRAHALRKMLEHCYDLVPYYREVFSSLKIRRRHLREPSILKEIPILEKSMVAENAEKLRATYLPIDQRATRKSESTGTTGQPTIIHHSKNSMGMFPWLKQRELRWFRYDPMGTLLSIRSNFELPRTPDGKLLKAREILKLKNWPYTTNLFQTGRSWGFIVTNTIEDQLELLNKLQPNYLITQSSGLEHLSMQTISDEAKQNLRAVQGIANTLTANMRQQVESALGVPVHQNYGLNEIGIVAARCPEGGRYHVHEEHCHVEIVNEDGTACPPGSSGKLLVTSLSNHAMPLLRYDADDLAQSVGGACSCGRNLASFGDIQGRYRRTAYLPEGTFQRWAALQKAVYKVAKDNPAAIHKYQAYQHRNGAFEFRLDCTEEVFSELEYTLSTAFENAFTLDAPPEFTVLHTNKFRGEQERKFQSFISEFTPEMDR